MRKVVLTFISLLAISAPLRADKVSPQQAAAVAERFLSAESPLTKASGSDIHLTGTWPQAQTKSEEQEPALYLFERDGGGYVVVAADDVSLPIIGYSTTGRLPQDKLPCNLRYLLDWHASVIDYARKHSFEASADTRAQWQSVRTNEEEEVVLETARWDQSGLPWNAMIPTLDGKECHAGCVATAMAIVMRYHQWPERGEGTLPSYYWYSGRRMLEGHALGHTYDWSQMPLVYEEGKYNQEQANQVAQLLYDLAIMSEMDFSPWGSGAAGDCPFRLTQYFGYDKQMRLSEADYYSMEVWEQMIRDEINLARPIFYFGYDKDWEGHAFVVDGYKGHYFSINYGWSGYGNDFYLLKPAVDLDPHAVTDFTLWPGMITHIFPDQGGETVPQFTDDELVAFPWDFRSKSFPVGGRLLTAYSSEETEVQMGFVLFDREGRPKEATTGEPVLVSTKDPYIPELTCNITCAIEDGDCLKLAQLMDGEWTPIQQSANAYLEFHPGKKISELLSLDYMLGDEDNPHLNKLPYLYLRGVKDIYWEIWSVDRDELLATSKSTSSIKTIDGQYYSLVTRWTQETNEYRAVIQYPSGNYRLFIRNFDEEMTVYIKL